MKKLKIYLFYCLIILLSSCIQLRPVYITKIKSMSVEKVTLNEAIIKLNIMVSNHNHFKIKIKDPEFEAYLNNTLLGRVEMDTNNIIIPKRSEQEYSVYVKADVSNNLLGSFISIIKNKKMPISIQGNATVKGFIFSKHLEINANDTISINSNKSPF